MNCTIQNLWTNSVFVSYQDVSSGPSVAMLPVGGQCSVVANSSFPLESWEGASFVSLSLSSVTNGACHVRLFASSSMAMVGTVVPDYDWQGHGMASFSHGLLDGSLCAAFLLTWAGVRWAMNLVSGDDAWE